MAAALTHYVSSDRLTFIAANIPKIAIVTGDEDHLVDPAGSERIKAGMDQAIRRGDGEDAKRVEFLRFEGTGHAIHIQKRVQINELVERCAKEGRAMLDAGWKGFNI
jgi:pimeloyl-ACP methyl ester carboxylesterase